MSRMHLTGVRDGDPERGDDRACRVTGSCPDDIAIVTFSATLAGYAAVFEPIGYP
jgi:hypothetical protein